MGIPVDLFTALRNGDRSALARAITLIESTRESDKPQARALLEACMPFSGQSIRIGMTGIPGAGKSTMIDVLGLLLLQQEHRVAVLAIDPSSARSGGSILGDKTRMERLAQEDGAFIRPTAAAGHLGGVGRRTREAIVLCEAAGYDRLLIETVGTGQTELEADALSDVNVLLLIAGAGDELQGIKRGIMESADVIVFTKCDTAKEHARKAAGELRSALQLLPPRWHGGRPAVLVTSAITQEGIDELATGIESLSAKNGASGKLEQRRREQDLLWLDHAVNESLRSAFMRHPGVAAALPSMKQAVLDRDKSPFAAADEMLELFRKGDGPLP
ncbi:MAG: methylmalonyl Co-A mutase-associated GTPase MeaB [Flavobacteriales bacterium]|nr:methylmalonyl Co-A mutase-associated GTPase MeaB [Flavobacteriales bacterium]